MLTRAKQEARYFNELLQHYAIERFLYRLGRSLRTDKLLLKGALLLVIVIMTAVRKSLEKVFQE